MAKYRRSITPRDPGQAALPLVAIVGRPNVGKSTLFNRLTHTRRSIVGDEPGITRDRIYGEFEWLGRQFRVVDTGGMVPDDPELIPTEIYNQAKVALEEADAMILVVDARTELASPDYDLVAHALRGGKPLFLAVNKVEGDAMAARRRTSASSASATSSPSAPSMASASAICLKPSPKRSRPA